MGVDSVEYHRSTVLARGDDHPGQALAYYASRGETPLLWGGAGARALGLEGAVTDEQYEALYGPGGACDPTTGERLVRTTRPGPGAGDLGPQVGGRAGRHRPGRGHAPDHGRRARRHPGLPRRPHPAHRRPPGTRRRAHPDRGPDLRHHPPRHLPGRRPLPARPRAGGQRRAHGRRQGRLEGGRHRPVAGAPPRRHHGRADGLRPPGGRAGLRHRRRRRPVREARPLGHRRRARGGDGDPLQAGGRDPGRDGRHRPRLLPGPQRRRPGHPRPQAPHARWASCMPRWKAEIEAAGWSVERIVARPSSTRPRRTAGPTRR